MCDADCWAFIKKLESFAYWLILICFVSFGIMIPMMFSFSFVFIVVTSLCITYSGSDTGHPCLSPLSKCIGDDSSRYL